MKALGEAMATHFPDVPPNALAHLARVNQPLAQVPPRGAWKQSGGVVLQYVDRWLDRPLVEPDPPEIVRRYLRAFGPASAADVGAWSGLTRLAAAAQGHGRPGRSTRTRTARRCSTSPTARSPTRTPRRRCGCSAPTTTSGSPTPPATGSPTPRSASSWMGAQRRRRHDRSSSTAGSRACGASRTAAPRSSSCCASSPRPNSPSSTTSSTASPTCSPADPLGSLLAGQPPARGPRQQRGDGGDAGGRRAQHLGAEPHGRARRRR